EKCVVDRRANPLPCQLTFPRWPTGSTVPRRHIAWGLLARDNDTIKADSPFGLRHIFHRHISIHNLKDRLTVIWLGRSVSKRIFHRAVLVARVAPIGWGASLARDIHSLSGAGNAQR